jgi:NADPH-dependent curcumin reductase CurA
MEESIREGVLTLNDGENDFEVFCHPCHFSEGEVVEQPLYATDPENIIRVEPQKPYIKKIGRAFEHEILAKVVDSTIPTVKIGDILMKLGRKLPGDIESGEYVHFTTDRIDAY